MITIISPATTMNFDKDSNLENSSNPVFKEDVNYLISILKELNIKEISNLMNLSEDLSKLNYDRYQNLLDSNNKKLQSILAFDGEVFNSMNTSDFNEYDFNFANDHLRILSGLRQFGLKALRNWKKEMPPEPQNIVRYLRKC